MRSALRYGVIMLVAVVCSLGVVFSGAEVAVAALDCGLCHAVTYQNHPLTNCNSCHGHYYGSDIDHQGDLFSAKPAGTCLSSCHVSDYLGLVLTGTSTYQHGSADSFGVGSPYIYAPQSPLGQQSSITARQYGCVDCHSASYPAVYSHDESAIATSHLDAIAGTSCEACHSNSLVTEHVNDCTVCHSSTRTPVLSAIANGETSCIACHGGVHSRSWGPYDYYSWESEGPDGTLLSELGANPANPGVHANYMATTAKCGICHSVHRALGSGVKLLNSSVATCAGCHRAGTGTITTKLVTWQTGGPHSSGTDGSCTSRRCHTASPHGVGVSSYKLLGGKLISVQADPIVAAALALGTDATRGFNATDLNQAVGDNALSAGAKSVLVAGYTCNQADCHYNTTLAVLERNWAESRDAMYPLGAGATAMKTGHLSVAASNVPSASYSPVNSCVSCHDQTDAGTTSGYTFPHSQTAYGATNMGTGRAYLWMGYAGNNASALTALGADNKAYDGTCLKCHRTAVSGIGISK